MLVTCSLNCTGNTIKSYKSHTTIQSCATRTKLSFSHLFIFKPALLQPSQLCLFDQATLFASFSFITLILILLPGKGETLETAKIETRANTASNGITEMVEQIPKKFPLDFNDESKETSAIAKTETPILLAARYRITEMVQQILEMFPTAINDNSEGKNLVLSAVQNRQSHVLQLLLKKKFVKRKLIHEVDMSENNALHLAAEMGKQKPWLIPGAALQMQWEIKWYEV